MAVREFIGMRVVPIIGRIGEESFIWDGGAYEHLTIVMTEGGQTYMSRCEVPAGTPLTDTHYWAKFAEFNAQFALLQRTVEEYSGRITQAQGDASSALTQVDAAELVIADLQEILAGFTTDSTVADAIQSVGRDVADVDAKIGTLPEGQTDVVGYVGQTAAALDSKIGTLPEGQSNVVDFVNDEVGDIDAMLAGFEPDETVKGYVDDGLEDLRAGLLSNLTNGSEVNWDVTARHFRPSGYEVVQGFCIFEQNGITYWAQGEINTDNDGQVNIYRVDTNSLVGSVTGNFAHIHGISYVDGVLYLDASLHDVAVGYVAISVANPANPVVITPYTQIQTPNDISRICFVSPTEIHMFSWSTCKVWVHDLTTGTETLKVSFEDTDLVSVTVQNFSYDAERNIYVIGTYRKCGAAIYDATTGKRLNWIDLPTLVHQVSVQESEGACICNGKLYINAAESEYTLKLTSLFVWDFTSGTVLTTLDMRPAQSTNGVYLRVDVSNSGDLVHPTQANFRLASDAVNLMRSQGLEFQLDIHIAGDTYSYPLFIADVCSRIFANNDNVTLSAPIVIRGGNCIVYDIGKMIFNFASGTDAIITYGCEVYIDALPQISGTATTIVNATYNSRLCVPVDIELPRAVVSRSIAFVKNSTNFVTNRGAIITI